MFNTTRRSVNIIIIHEMCGSSDKDVLRATAGELTRLKQHLKRIILVSHQEEFTDRFPVVAQLRHCENGTQAHTLRR